LPRFEIWLKSDKEVMVIFTEYPRISSCVKAHSRYSNIYPTRCSVTQFISSGNWSYVFRVVVPPEASRAVSR